MLKTLASALFGMCLHRRTTFPLTPKVRGIPVSGGTYVTCLDCGKEFRYDWDTMRLEKAELSRPKTAGKFSDQPADGRIVATRVGTL